MIRVSCWDDRSFEFDPAHTALVVIDMQRDFVSHDGYVGVRHRRRNPLARIIPELLKKERIPKANGLITSFTYLGIIIGTFLASFLTQITNKNFPLTAGIGMVLAIFGFLASVFIPKTPTKQSTEKVNPFFFHEIYNNLVYTSKNLQ